MEKFRVKVLNLEKIGLENSQTLKQEIHHWVELSFYLLTYGVTFMEINLAEYTVCYQYGCCLQAIAVILADIILFLSDWLCSSQYFVVEFALQEEFLPKGS